MHAEKASDPTTCTESCDILLHFIKRFFNKSKKCMTRDSILHSHISVSQGHSLVERYFSTDWDAEGKRQEKYGMFCVFLCFVFPKRRRISFYF